jgi:drug/metabolite transporter (DMT)-like permease
MNALRCHQFVSWRRLWQHRFVSPYAIGLVLASAFLHALWNALLKQEADVEAAAVGVVCIALISSLALVPWTPGPAFPQSVGYAWASGAGLFEAGYFISLAMALLRAPLGFAYTVARGTAIALVWPISVLWLGEPINAFSAVGVLTLYAGLLVVGLGSQGRGTGPGLRWSFVCGACVAGYHLCYKEALAAQVQAPALFSWSLAIASPINVLRLGAAGRARLLQQLRTRPRPLLLAGVTCTASFVVFLNSLNLAGAGAVLTLRNTSIVFAQGLALLIGERLGRRQLLGALLVAAGAVFIGWPR